MFVAIDNIDLNAHDMDALINSVRDNDGKISPVSAMDILSKTNHIANIKKVLTNIKRNCTTKEQLLPYKEFILSCVDMREVSGVALADLREMAKVCDCEKEFDEANDKHKVYMNTDVKGRVVYNKYDLKNVESDEIPIFIDLSKGNSVRDRVSFRSYNFSNVVGIKCKEGGQLEFYKISNIRKNFVLEGAGIVKFGFCEWVDGSERLDLIGCRSLRISSCVNLPDDIDASSCKVVNFYAIDMSKFDKVKFGDDVDLTFDCCKNMPEKLDLSFASDVGFVAVDLSKVKELKFKDGANVECASQVFNSGDVDTVLPEYIDFSNCGEVKLQGVTTALKQVKFRDRAQGGDWAETYEKFYKGKNKIVYADEEKAKNIRLFSGGMGM